MEIKLNTGTKIIKTESGVVIFDSTRKIVYTESGEIKYADVLLINTTSYYGMAINDGHEHMLIYKNLVIKDYFDDIIVEV